jgi:drug/metabolite transporter (DMT)-like permease
MAVTETREKQKFCLTDLLLLLMTVIWAVNFSVAKFGTQQFNPIAFLTLRVALSAVALGVITLVRRKPRLSGAMWIRLLLLGVIGHGLYQYCFIVGISQTRAGNAALIVAAAPAFIAMASRLRGLERVKRTTIAGIALSVSGVALVILGSARSTDPKQGTLLGALLIFCGVLCWTAFTVGLQPLTKKLDPIQISGITMIGGLIPLLIFTAPALMRQDWVHVTALGWGAAIYSSIVSMVIGYLFWYRGLRVLGPTRTGIYLNIQPVVALMVAWIFLKEVPTMWQSVGMATIVSGIFLTRT